MCLYIDVYASISTTILILLVHVCSSLVLHLSRCIYYQYACQHLYNCTPSICVLCALVFIIAFLSFFTRLSLLLLVIAQCKKSICALATTATWYRRCLRLFMELIMKRARVTNIHENDKSPHQARNELLHDTKDA